MGTVHTPISKLTHIHSSYLWFGLIFSRFHSTMLHTVILQGDKRLRKKHQFFLFFDEIFRTKAKIVHKYILFKKSAVEKKNLISEDHIPRS